MKERGSEDVWDKNQDENIGRVIRQRKIKGYTIITYKRAERKLEL